MTTADSVDALGVARTPASAQWARRTASWPQVAFATDIAMLAEAGFVGLLVSHAQVSASRVCLTLSFSLMTLAIVEIRGIYGPPPYLQQIEAARALIMATVLAAATLLWVVELAENSPSVGREIAEIWLFGIVFLSVGRVFLAVQARYTSSATNTGCPTLIVGAGKVGVLVARRLLAHPEIGLKPVGFLDKEPLYSGDTLDIPVFGASWDLERVVRESSIEHVIVAFSTAPNDVLLRLLKVCDELNVRTSFVPRLYEQTADRLAVRSLGGVPLVSSRFADLKGRQLELKYALDRVVAGVALLLLSPLMGTLAVVVWLSMGRPILFRQARVGRDGERFDMLKFRSMHIPTNPENLVIADDRGPGGVVGPDRRTRVGAIMRLTSLDELPQLLNVLKGEMSLVGPRPERPEFVDIFKHTVYRYGERHRVKSGITGWAQVCGFRGKTSLADRIEWDNHYIENWSFWFDLKILLMTLVAVTRVHEAE